MGGVFGQVLCAREAIMKQDIAERLEILENQREEARQMRREANKEGRKKDAWHLRQFINFTNRCIQECYMEDAENWLDSLPEKHGTER